jgi:hypothetical protein
MHRIALELTRRALTLRVELTPENSAPSVIETQGAITVSDGPGLAKTRPSNVVPFSQLLRKAGSR